MWCCLLGSSPKSKKGSGKKGKTPEPEPEPEPQEPTGPPPPEPGSEEWEFVNLPLEKVRVNFFLFQSKYSQFKDWIGKKC